MTIINNRILFLTVALVLGSIIAISAFSSPSTAFANHDFVANLTGQEEVPAVDSQATGEARFTPILPSNDTLDFIVNASGIQNVTQGHIHSGALGENGPIVVTLFTFDPAQNPDQNGIIINGTITAINLEGPLQGKVMSDLLTAINSNSTYVNIHTVQNPNGEIRGQLLSTK
ncbi:MAG: CHRD domain-containing protein [Candidatus Nitrosocosmicus sp.]|nr:CHRD domain-containing protein [Candidatus Nitrosocosmicus sp.]MDN5865940.1 CHRD domain-containing protein [Candidatus Nitrosocosmicus sp.]